MAIPRIVDDQLVLANARPIRVGSPAWFRWLENDTPRSFSYRAPQVTLTLRRENKRNGEYWYAYRTRQGQLGKSYVGKSSELTVERLRAAAARLSAAPASPPARVRLEFFGAPHVWRGKETVVLNAKAMALLAFLAARAEPVARDKILALLWQDSAPDAARKNLRNLLWHLRRAVAPDVVTGNQELELAPALACDVRTFRLARQATQAGPAAGKLRAWQTMRRLYRGAFLDGFALDDAPEFEVWLVAARAQFDEAYLDALQALVDAAQAQGQWRQVSEIAHAAISHDPLQEPMYRALMEAHARLGDRVAALRHYDTLRETLDRELGVAPLPETEKVRVAIVNGTLSDEPRTTQDERQGARRKRSSAGAHPSPFIGRARELAVLTSAWREAQTGRAGVALLVGEAGIGKSRLWQTWSDSPEPSVTCLSTRALPSMTDLPFAPLVDLLRAPALRERLIKLGEPTAPAWLSDIARLTPELREAVPRLPPPPPLPPVEEQRHIFEALVAGLGVSPARPLILFLDDLQWADRSTLDWLGYLLHRLRDEPFLFVGAYRPEEAPPALVTLLAQWGREGILTRLVLERLSRGESLALVNALRGDSTRAGVLFEQSAGNPYFLIELARAAPGELPAALSDLIETRLARLDEAARQILQAAAVIQQAITFPLLQFTAGRTDDETLDALDILREAGLVLEQDGHYIPGHPLVSAVVERGLSGARRARLHQRAAEALERMHAQELPLVAGRLMRHYAEARQPERAAHYAELAAARALSLAAWSEATSLYERAYALEASPARSYGLGMALTRAGEIHKARQIFERALAEYHAANDPRGAARVAIEIARSYLATGQADHVIEWIQRGRASLGVIDDPETRALAEYLMGAELRAAGKDLAQAEQHFVEGLELARRSRASGLIGEILLELGNVRAQRGNLPAAVQSFRALVEHARASGDINSQVLGYNNLAYHMLLQGNTPAAQRAIEQGLQLADERDMQMARQWLYSTRGEVALAEHAWDTAEEWFRRGMTQAERFGNREQVANYEMNLALAARGRGQPDDALLGLERARAQATTPFLQAQIDLWLTQVHLERHELAAAREALRRVQDLTRASSYDGLRMWMEHLQSALNT